MKQSTLIFFFAILHLILRSQKETHNWFFSNYCALTFSTNPPTSLGASASNAASGCGASLSDKNGHLLFYSNGAKIWNKQHVVMANGNSLSGGLSVDQSALAIKQPGANTNYYVFTPYLAGSTFGGFKYSVVDMALASGFGSVTILNVSLLSPSCEKVTATRHCNGTDFWIMTHEMNTSNFHAYLLTASGLIRCQLYQAAADLTQLRDMAMEV